MGPSTGSARRRKPSRLAIAALMGAMGGAWNDPRALLMQHTILKKDLPKTQADLDRISAAEVKRKRKAERRARLSSQNGETK
jgi:hypothetical protein